MIADYAVNTLFLLGNAYMVYFWTDKFAQSHNALILVAIAFHSLWFVISWHTYRRIKRQGIIDAFNKDRSEAGTR